MITFVDFLLDSNSQASQTNTGTRVVNGQVPESLLMAVDQKGNKLVQTAAIDFLRASKDAQQNTGQSLKLVGPNSSYRTYKQQEDMARQYGIGQAARPGRSNHGFGLSIDLVKDTSWKWFVTNGPRYGFYQLNSTNEAHHFDYKKNVLEFQSKSLVYSDNTPAKVGSETSYTQPGATEEPAPTAAQGPVNPVDSAMNKIKSGFEMITPKL